MNFNKRMRLAQEKADEGKAALKNANYQLAADAFLTSADLSKGIKGQEKNYAACLVNATTALAELGSYEQAKKLIEKTLLIQKQFLGSNHADIAGSLNNLANIYGKQGDYEQAKSLHEQALEIRRKVLPANHPDIATSLNNLANIYSQQGDCEQAKSLHEQVLKIRKKVLSADHPDIAQSLNNLANIYYKQRDYEQAQFLHEQALEIQIKVLPADHPNIAGSLNNLTNIYRELGDYEKAKSSQERANDILGKKLGVNHPDTYMVANNLANTIIEASPPNDNSFTFIVQLHEALFQFFVDVTSLETEHKSEFTFKQIFTLRTSKNDEQGRLSKGYWFLGDDEQLYFSCWKGIDTTVQMPAIAIIIDIQQQVTLQFNGKDSAKKAKFLADLTKLLGGFSQSSDANGKLEARWRKTYSQETWKEALVEFFISDKPQIDEYLAFNNNMVEDFTPIPEKEFAQSLKFTLFLREKLKETASTETRELDEVGKPLKLQFLQLENIGHFESVGFDLSRQITILIGENGSGKSTVLKAIALGLSGVTSVMDKLLLRDYLRLEGTDIVREGVERNFCNDGSISLSFQINTPQNQRIEFYNREFGGVECNTAVESHDEWLLSNENNFIDLVLGFPQGKKREAKFLTKDKQPHLNDLISLIEDRDATDWMKDLVDWFHELSTKETSLELTKIQTVFDLISKIVSDSEDDQDTKVSLKGTVHSLETNKKEAVVCTPDMPNGVPLDLVSQGYHNVFVWVGRLIMRLYDTLEVHQQEHHSVSKNKFLKNLNTRGKRYEANSIYELHGIILIDEIDTYLHPKWQRNILQMLAEIFPCLQFVVTSHSSMVLSYLKQWKNASVFKVTADEIIPIHHFYGRNEIDLFWELHGIEARPKEIQEKIDALYSAFDAEEVDEAKSLLSELKEILGGNDPIVVELETSIDLMEQLS